MTDYPTTWWKHTGKMSEFEHGISSPILCNLVTSEELPSSKLPVGALYASNPTMKHYVYHTGPDGLTIFCVRFPNDGDWCIDGRASNCTLPHDKEHRCWVRYGTVGEKLTVDKNGLTCAAGAGSFFMDDQKWHGFLRDGVLRQG